MKEILDYIGQKLPKDECKLINRKYYKIGEACFQLRSTDGVLRWNRIDNGLIAYNCVDKKWDYITNLEKTNLVKYIKELCNGSPIYEYDKDSFFKVKVKSSQTDSTKESIQKQIKTFIEAAKRIEVQLRVEVPEINKDLVNLFINEARYKNPKLYSTSEEREKVQRCLYEVFIGRKDKHTDSYYLLYSEWYKRSYQGQLKEQLINITRKIEKEQAKLKNMPDVQFSGFCRDILTAYRLGFKDLGHPDTLLLEGLNKRNLSPGNMPQYRRTINYNANTESSTFNDTVFNYYRSDNSNRKLDANFYKIARLLKGFTFGVELETAAGGLMEKELDAFGIIPLKDGSITGWEYATVPFGYATSTDEAGHLTLEKPSTKELAKDLKLFVFACEQLSQKAMVNEYCSLHIHVGNIRDDKLFMIAFYMLCCTLQDELFLTQPMFKLDGPKYINSKKNYCGKLPDLGLFNNCIFSEDHLTGEKYCDNVLYYYNLLFKFLSNGRSLGPRFNRINKQHPLGKKWERTERYNWINLVNCVFNNIPTIEFRLHSATTNPYKIINWMLICNAMLKFTENNMKEIINNSLVYNLDTVLRGYTNNFRSKKDTTEFGIFIYDYLSEYVLQRKRLFKELSDKGDYRGTADYEKDSNYVFEYNGMTLF